MESNTSIDCVITRYREYIDWIQYLPNTITNIFIYNKGSPDGIFKYYTPTGEILKKIKIIPMENIGRIDHTLAFHILANWDSLPDLLLSLPGSIMISENKGRYFTMIMKKITKIKSDYAGFYAPRFRKVSASFNYSVDDYQLLNQPNRNNNPFIKSEYRDFKTWKLAIIDSRPMNYIAMRGTFAVSKENILHIDKKIYKNILISLSVGDNIENGHFTERIWAHLFRQYSFDSIPVIPSIPSITSITSITSIPDITPRTILKRPDSVSTSTSTITE